MLRAGCATGKPAPGEALKRSPFRLRRDQKIPAKFRSEFQTGALACVGHPQKTGPRSFPKEALRGPHVLFPTRSGEIWRRTPNRRPILRKPGGPQGAPLLRFRRDQRNPTKSGDGFQTGALAWDILRNLSPRASPRRRPWVVLDGVHSMEYKGYAIRCPSNGMMFASRTLLEVLLECSWGV